MFGMMFFPFYNAGWGGMAIMVVVWVLGILCCVGLVRWLALGWGGSHHGCCPGHSEKTPLEILRERYAKGEINKAEYEERKKDLKAP